MLILPLDKKPTRENFPFITLLLLLANVLVFALLQGGDSQVEEAAADRYIDSGVLVDEWAWFGEWTEFAYQAELSADEVDQWLPPAGRDRQGDRLRLMLIDSRPGFHRALEDGLIIDTDGSDFDRWRQARSQLEADRAESFTRRYLLRYDEIAPLNLLSHMFMHGGAGHLIGNMVFLVLLGLLLEPVLGGLRLLALYLISGLGAAGTTLALSWGIDSGMLGASGAIAGLMGLYAVVYGRRKVRFFYWAFVYFDYVRAPALVLLPLWLGWELVAWMLHEGSNIAYDAHIGGLVSGALLGFVVVRTGQLRHDALETGDRAGIDEDRRTIAAAEQALDRLDARAAKQRLKPLLSKYPDETRLWRLYFAACRLRADDSDLDAAANRILRLPGATAEQRELIVDSFRQYRQVRGGRLKIPVSLAVPLATRLAGWGEVGQAGFLVDLMSRSSRPVPGLADAARALAEQLEQLGDDASAHYRRLAQSAAGAD